jgi:hypothetical protein
MSASVPAGQPARPLRRQFRLPEGDEDYLQAIRWEWETIIDAGLRWLLIYSFPIPSGYNTATAHIALQIPSGYPDAQLDMVYFSPALSRNDGCPINALADQTIEGQNWQRWSRHRTAENPWRPGVDDVSTHVALIEDWLQREFSLR